ncbi:MAG TPA: hemerythrin domain-containing protein [Propionicimonas sp.]|nr:hemerythrin domain-containing protein [Propionicimonas sp.]
MAEHVEIINATGQLRAAVHAGEADRVEVTRGVVAALLWPHTSAEEDGLFRVLHREEQFAAHIDGLCEEHTSLELYLAAITPGDEVAMAQFENALRDHIDKEDNGLFPAAAIALNGDQWTEVHAATPHQHGEHTHAHA